MEQKKNYQYRFIARIVLEAATPLCVGSGEKEIHTDAIVARDANGLPYIPGTSIAGVVRHALGYENDELNRFFGFQSNKKDAKGNTKGQGSEVIFSDAKMVGKEGKAIDGLQSIDFDKDLFYAHFKSLPVRQHVRINDRGVAADHGKFDEEIVYKGTRFCFEIEVVSESDCTKQFNQVLDVLYSAEFRIGGGSRKGFGKMKVVSCKSMVLDLCKEKDLEWYLEHSSDLSVDFDGDEYVENEGQGGDVVRYELTLEPSDFFLFGAGFGDSEADLVPVKEKVVVWNNGKPDVKDNQILIPASSIKGALAHRTAFHYNKLKGRFVGCPDVKVGNDNEAVQALFGYTSEDGKTKQRGNVLFEDIIKYELDETNKEKNLKLFNHVSIDRFTGGAIDGALFQEKAVYGKGQTFTTTITLLKKDIDAEIVKSFEEAMMDICRGMLPLGGGVNKGYGCFGGTLKRGEEVIYENRI